MVENGPRIHGADGMESRRSKGQIWEEMVVKYPRHELTPEAEKWARQ